MRPVVVEVLLVAGLLSVGRAFVERGAGSSARCRRRLMMRDSEDINFSKIVIGPVLALGIGFTAFTSTGSLFGAPTSQQTVRVTRDDGTIETRGALTKLTRGEIQRKLSQVPVFYVRQSLGGVALDGSNKGTFFLDVRDAEKAASGKSVSATTLDDVYYALLEKKGKVIAGVGGGAAALSDLAAEYKIVPSSAAVAFADGLSPGWRSTAGEGRAENAVPLFSAEKLAFQGIGRPKIPLFTAADDLKESWERLESSNPPTIKVTTLQAILSQMER
jgi:hypothetical protein